jgi:RNA polymerase sigma-70 factor (ECF subfamily)
MPNDCLLRAWRAHEAELLGFLRRRLPEPHTAEDLLQDIFVKALGQGKRFCSLENARAWLFRVTRNTLADHLRLAREQVELPEDLVEETEQAAPVESLADCLPRALAELSPDDREAITLCDLEGMSQEAYAQHKGLTLPGAKSRVQRARKRLREHLSTACQVRFDETGRVCCFVPRKNR